MTLSKRIRTGAAAAALALLAFATVGVPQAAAMPAPGAPSRAEVQRMIVEEALNSRVPPELALAVAKVESDFQARALSPAGARGVMQIMPKTARDVFGVGEHELWDARLNVQLGIGYLEKLYDQYGRRWDLALSHYNGGTLAGGPGANARPHGYTRKYVADVLRWQGRFSEQAAVWQTARRLDDSGWRPARTLPVSARPWRNPEAAAAPRPAKAAAPLARPWRLGAGDEPWADIERRRLLLRRSLDDFAPVVTWTDG